MQAAQTRKETRYVALMDEIRNAQWSPELFTIEVGARGLVGGSTFRTFVKLVFLLRKLTHFAKVSLLLSPAVPMRFILPTTAQFGHTTRTYSLMIPPLLLLLLWNTKHLAWSIPLDIQANTLNQHNFPTNICLHGASLWTSM